MPHVSDSVDALSGIGLCNFTNRASNRPRKMAKAIDIKALRKKLQKLVGSSPKIQVSGFTNWAATQVLHQVLTVIPTTVQQVQAIVRAARMIGLRVRAAGSGHSWSPLFADEGQVLVYMSALQRDGPRIQLNQLPGNKKTVTVVTGVTTAELKEFQLQHGVCLPTNVILGCVQMGGVVTTGCHGAGWDAKTICDYVVALNLVDSGGELRHFTVEDTPEEMKALQCSLGLWGIITELTFKMDPMMIVESRNMWIKVKDLFYDQQKVQELLHNNWSVEMFWFPFNGISGLEAAEAFIEKDIDLSDWDPLEDEVWVRVVNPPSIVGKLTNNKTYELQEMQSWWRMQGLDMVDGFVSRFPHIAPAFLRSQVPNLKLQLAETLCQHLPHAVHFLSNVEKVPVREMEWAFTIDEDCRNVCYATQKVVQLVHAEALEGRFPINLPLELRFIADSDALLSPAVAANPLNGGTGHTCFLEVLTVTGTPGWNEFSEKVAEIWMSLPGARPHWGKEWEHLPNIDTFIRQAYDSQFTRFLQLLEAAGVDPGGMFFNKRLEAIFHPNGHAGRGTEVIAENTPQPTKPDCQLQ